VPLLIAVTGYGAAVLLAFISLPQVLRLLRSRDTTGVSAPTWVVSVACGACWTEYGITTNLWPTILSNALYALGALLVLRLLSKRVAALGVLTAASVFAISWALPVGVVGVVAVLITLGAYAPQARASLREDLSGVAMGTWALALATEVLWALYGILTGVWAVAAPSAVTAPLALLILLRTRHAHRLASQEKAGQKSSPHQ
jgi:MtN3 and saliva related transmembrane protein